MRGSLWWVSTTGNFFVHRQTEIARVISLPGDSLPWGAGHHLKDGAIFEENEVCLLDGIGDVYGVGNTCTGVVLLSVSTTQQSVASRTETEAWPPDDRCWGEEKEDEV